MGLKELESYYPADSSIKADLERTRENLGLSPNFSLLAVLARRLKEEGTAGLRKASRMIDDSGMAHRLTPEDFILTPPEIKKALADHRAAIIFGVIHPIIQRMLFYGEFNEREWWDEYNLALVGTPFDNSRTGKDRIEEISAEELNAMREAAKRDITLACFFEKDFDLLPTRLKKILDDLKVLSIIKSAILPLYKVRAKFLVE